MTKTSSDKSGNFEFKSIAPGTYAVVANKIAFKTAATIATVSATGAKPLDIALEAEQSLSLPVLAQRLDRARNGLSPTTGGSKYTFTEKALQQLPEGNNTSLDQVLLQAPGVVQDGFGAVHVRGDHGNLQYRLNGILLPQGVAGFAQILTPRFAREISLLTGALPAEYGDLPTQPQNTDGVLTVKSIICLLSIFAFFLCIGALWAFLEPLGARYGIDGQTVGFIVSASLAVQVAGAIAATWATDRMTYLAALFGCGLVAIAASAVLAGDPSPALFWAASLAIGFVWMFIIPFQVGMAVAADQTRSTALLVPAANLIGAGLGPLVASIFIVGNDVGPVPYFGIGAVLASIALVVLFRALVPRPVPA